MSAPADTPTVHQVTCQRCCHTAHVGTRLSALEWALADMGWSTTGIGQHTCPECADATDTRIADDTYRAPSFAPCHHPAEHIASNGTCACGITPGDQS